MKKKNFIISLLTMCSIFLSSCFLARQKQELIWSKWYDNGDGTHTRHNLNDIEDSETDVHHFVLISTIEEPTEVAPGKALYTCEQCGCREEKVVPPTGNYVFNQKVVDDKYLLERYSEHSAAYYMSSVEGAFGDPRYVFEVSDVPSGYTEVDYVESDSRQWIDTGVENDNHHDVSINNSSKNPRIPANFQELEYIESTGLEYIDTGIKVSSDVSYELTYQFKELTENECDIFGTDVSPYDFVGVCAGKFRYVAQDSTILYQDMDTNVHHVVKRNNEVKVDDVVLYTSTPTESSILYNYYLFAASKAGEKTVDYFSRAKLFGCKIWNKDVLVREFVPAKRLTDNDIGLFDVVSKVFYSNSGEGQFINGSEVNYKPNSNLPSEYVELEYIESTGSQSINLDTTFDLEKGTIELDFQSTLLDQNGMIVGKFSGDYDTRYIWIYYYSAGPNRLTIYLNGNSSGQQALGNVPLDLNRHNISYKNKTYYLDNTECGSATGTLEMTGNLYLFSGGQSYNFFGKMYSFSLDNGDGLVRDLVPCYRVSDGTTGMYDLISEQLFVNEGTGEFIRGPEIGRTGQLPSEYQQVEYVKSDGNQWINADVIYNPADTAAQIADIRILDEAMHWCGSNYYLQYGFSPDYVNTHDRVTMQQQYSSKNLKTFINGTLVSNKKFDITMPANVGTGVFRLMNNDGNWYKSAPPGDAPSSQILYSLKIYKNSVLTRDFVPCYKKSNNEVGLFDLVTSTFFANEGTSPLLKGDDVNAIDGSRDYNALEKANIPEYYYQLNYIESNGLQSLYTGVTGGSTIDATIRFIKNNSLQIMGYSNTGGHFIGVGKDNNYLHTTIEAGNIDHIYADISDSLENKGSIKINDGDLMEFDVPDLEDNSLKLFSVGTSANRCVALLYGAKIYQGGSLVRDFIPVMQKQTRAVGLYDLVNQRFFESETSYPLESGGIMFEGINSSHINVFCNLNSNKSHPYSLKINSYKVYEGRTVVKDYVSVIRNSDGVAGLYDLKNNEFSTSNSEFPLSYGKIIGHKLDEGTIAKKPTYNEQGEMIYKCVYTNEEIHVKTDCTAYKVTFLSNNGNLSAIKIFNNNDPSNYYLSMVGYTRNVQTFNYSKYGTYINFEIPDDGEEYEVETTSGKVKNLEGRQYQITNITGDAFVQLKLKSSH